MYEIYYSDKSVEIRGESLRIRGWCCCYSDVLNYTDIESIEISTLPWYKKKTSGMACSNIWWSSPNGNCRECKDDFHIIIKKIGRWYRNGLTINKDINVNINIFLIKLYDIKVSHGYNFDIIDRRVLTTLR
eukprot:GHVR01122211.1.p1 GENE.GHVR01122211.1~~GHVR01122211.1.p1  ORF type:complete len:131 (-),score=19.53 GHVR01122211.1:29-421(-)